MKSLKQTDKKVAQYLGRAVMILKPEIFEELKQVIERPKGTLLHFQLLPPLLKRYCELKGLEAKQVVGIRQGSDAVQERIVFIAVVLKLYNPDLLTSIHTDAMRPNLREELARVLKCNSTWISQQVDNIRSFLNPYHPGKKAHQDFKKEVEDLVEKLETDFKQQ